MSLTDTIWSVYNEISQSKAPAEVIDEQLCKACNHRGIFTDTMNGMLICTHCGVISETDILDQTAEWNNNSESSKDPSRCGCPINPMLQKSSMSTMIVSNKYRFMKRLHQQMSMDYVERARYHVFESISKVGGEIGRLPPNVLEQAKYYYKVMSERKLSRGVIRKGLIACCLLHACKSMNVPRSMKEISNITSVPTSVLNKTNKLFLKIMCDVIIMSHQQEETALESTDSRHLIHRYCNHLQLDKKNEMELVRTVTKIDADIKESGLLDCKTPSAIVTGIIMYACSQLNIDISKYTISTEFDISVVTINKITKIISNFYKTQ